MLIKKKKKGELFCKVPL